MQLRYLQTVVEIAAENNSTTIFPLPMDLLSAFLGNRQIGSGPAAHPGTPALGAGTPDFTLPQVTATPKGEGK